MLGNGTCQVCKHISTAHLTWCCSFTITIMCDNYDAGCSAHHIIVIMNEQHHIHFLWCHWWSVWIQHVACCAKHRLHLHTAGTDCKVNLGHLGKNWIVKTAELSQRLRDAPNIWVHWKVSRVLTTHPVTFPEISNGLLFRSILRMCVQNLKFVALPFPEILGGYSKNLGSPCIRPHSIFSQIFNRLLFAWTLWIYLPNLKFVALPIPEIIGGLKKISGVPGFAHAPYSPKFLKGFCSDGPCEYTWQIWSS